jgi:ABC-type multidrug transport system ATPase subunit
MTSVATISTAPPILVANALSARVRSRQVLVNVSLRAVPGEIVAIAGENGGGKTTLLRILAGLAAPDAGEVWRGAALGYCPQDELLYARLTPDEHFRLFGRALRLCDDDIRRRSDELLRVLAFERDRKRAACELSAGTRQKLNLALALLGDPPLLLLDEPYHGFDEQSYERFWTFLVTARASGKCIVMVSHLVVDRGRFDRVLTLERGLLHETPS